MKRLFAIGLFVFVFINFSYGQKFEIQVNAGLSMMFFPDFQNRIYIVDQGFIVPDIITLTNTEERPLKAYDLSTTTAQPGFSGSVEFSYNPYKEWVHSIALGFSLWRHSYDNTVGREDLSMYDQQTISAERYNALEPVTLSKVTGSWGEVQTSYFEVQPLNISRRLFGGDFRVKTGPVFGFLLNSDHDDYAIKYNEGEEHTWEEIDNVYFTSVGDFEDVIFGLKLGVGFALRENISVNISGKYFSSVYAVGSNPIQLQAGISYSIWKISSRN